MFLFQSSYKYKHLKMYKNKKEHFLHLEKKQIKLTSICTILSMRKPNQQTFFLFSSEHSMANPLPPVKPHKTKSNISKT